ncbi:uncharacterized protein ACJ7VT_021805 [Polymixia lowei]
MVDNLLKCFLFLVVLDSVPAIQELKSINDLTNIDFGRKFPRHGLMLLHWFANNIRIDDNNIIQLNFAPNRGDYGIHYYGNYDRLLPDNRPTFHYYTVGNLNPNNHNNARALPHYVTRSFYNSRGNQDNNRDRITVRIQDEYGNLQTRRTVHQIYITQHNPSMGSAYDRANTYLIATNLLREIRDLPQNRPTTHTDIQQIQQRYRNSDENVFNDLRSSLMLVDFSLGLLLAIVLSPYNVRQFGRSILGFLFLSHRQGDDEDDDDLLQINLEVTTTRDGKAKICWSGIPWRLIQQGVMVALFKNNEDDALVSRKLDGGSLGSFDTSVPLNPGLQVRLYKCKGLLFRWFGLFPSLGKEVWRGPEFHDANGEMPVYIMSHNNASLQLFVKDGVQVRFMLQRTVLDPFTMVDNLLKCFLFLVVLDSVPAIQELNSISDLKNIDFGCNFPRHGLMLLHWFANNVHIDDNNIIQLNFEPNRGDYGFHHYSNYDRLLPDNRPTFHYYTVGNLNPDSNHSNARALPYYVTQNFHNSRGNQNNNRDRITVRIQDEYGNLQTRRTVHQVYITQHNPSMGSAYDGANTYLIATNLLREIRDLPQNRPTTHTGIQEIQQRYRNIDENVFNDLRSSLMLVDFSLGLLLAIVLSPYNVRQFGRSILGFLFLSHRQGDDEDDDDLLQINLEVTTTRDGKAKICWSGIPWRLIQQGVMVALFKNNEDNALVSRKLDGGSLGSFDTSVPLNPGLQVRLYKCEGLLFRWFGLFPSLGKEIQRGPEFHDANGEMPVYIMGHGNASLQLFVKDGKACVRLYVRKPFTDWKTKFHNCWVGIYRSTTTDQHSYKVYQWVIRFVREWRSDLEDIPDYNVYVFHSGVTISPGVQVRFMLWRNFLDPLVCTPPWE